MGQSCRFEREPGMSACPPTATELIVACLTVRISVARAPAGASHWPW
jgi:hypothetical protein